MIAMTFWSYNYEIAFFFQEWRKTPGEFFDWVLSFPYQIAHNTLYNAFKHLLKPQVLLQQVAFILTPHRHPWRQNIKGLSQHHSAVQADGLTSWREKAGEDELACSRSHVVLGRIETDNHICLQKAWSLPPFLNVSELLQRGKGTRMHAGRASRALSRVSLFPLFSSPLAEHYSSKS